MTGDIITVDARGHKCPVPSLKLQKAIKAAGQGARFRLLATDPMARIDVPFLMQQLGGRVIDVNEDESGLQITVVSGDGPPD